MEYNEMYDIKKLLESCYVNMIAIDLKKEVKSKIDEIQQDMDKYDKWLDQKEAEQEGGI